MIKTDPQTEWDFYRSWMKLGYDWETVQRFWKLRLEKPHLFRLLHGYCTDEPDDELDIEITPDEPIIV